MRRLAPRAGVPALVLAATSAALLASCGAAAPADAIVQDANLLPCAGGASRWAAGAGDGGSGYVATATWGGVDHDVIGAPGPAAWSDVAGQLYLLDPLAARVHVFDGDRAAAVLVSGGVARVVELPAFPQAFGPPGVFFAVEQDPETEVARVVRFSGR